VKKEINLVALIPIDIWIFSAFVMAIIISCSDKDPINAPIGIPVIATSEVTVTAETSAQCGGNITSNGGATVTACGVCWSTSPMPTIEDNLTNEGSGTGDFVSDIVGLSKFTTYFVRAYATNSAGTGYGDTVSFTAGKGSVTDIDGNTYQTVIIGNQWWMAENLKVTRYRNGDKIPIVTDNVTWAGLSTGAYCNYDNDELHIETYGRLYNWYAVDDNRNIAPLGWHVPTDEEWKQLEMYLGMNQSDADNTHWRGTEEGGKLKEDGTTHWLSPNIGATNESGFTALPGGIRGNFGYFYSIGSYAGFWSSTKNSSTTSTYRYLDSDQSKIGRWISNYVYNQDGFSIRCVKD